MTDTARERLIKTVLYALPGDRDYRAFARGAVDAVLASPDLHEALGVEQIAWYDPSSHALMPYYAGECGHPQHDRLFRFVREEPE